MENMLIICDVILITLHVLTQIFYIASMELPLSFSSYRHTTEKHRNVK